MSNLGHIYLFNNKDKGSWYSIAQRFFTGYQYSHTSIGMGDVLGAKSVLSSDHLCHPQPLTTYLNSGDIDMEVYEFKLGNKAEIDKIVSDFYQEFCSTSYAYIQVLWFAFYRWVCERFLKIDARKHHNWFASKNVICSELSYLYIKRLAEQYNLADLMELLSEWHKDNVHVGDIKFILSSFPMYFEKIK